MNSKQFYNILDELTMSDRTHAVHELLSRNESKDAAIPALSGSVWLMRTPYEHRGQTAHYWPAALKNRFLIQKLIYEF